MRPMTVVLIGLLAPVQAYAGTAGVQAPRLSVVPTEFDVGRLASFDGPTPRNEDRDLFLSPSTEPVRTAERSLLPSLDVGPFHATIGRLDGARAHLATYSLDTRDFWNSSISGSVDSRGAKVIFTLPTQ